MNVKEKRVELIELFYDLCLCYFKIDTFNRGAGEGYHSDGRIPAIYCYLLCNSAGVALPDELCKPLR